MPQAYEFLNYVHSAEGSAAVAEGSGYNPVAKGADALLSDEGARRSSRRPIRATRSRACGGGRSEPSWFAELRTQYAEKFKAA